MSPRLAFRNFMKFTLEEMASEDKIDFNSREIDTFILQIEDDPRFYEQLENFLKDYMEDNFREE